MMRGDYFVKRLKDGYLAGPYPTQIVAQCERLNFMDRYKGEKFEIYGLIEVRKEDYEKW